MSKKFRDRILEGSGYSNKKFECDFGLKLLQKMGWKEGNGLGKGQQGTTECVQVKRREEGLGVMILFGFIFRVLGIEENKKKFEWNDSWWENSYNNAVKTINIIKGFQSQNLSNMQQQKEESENTSDQSSSEDEKNKKQKKPKKVVSTKKQAKNKQVFEHLFSSCSSSSDEEPVYKKKKTQEPEKSKKIKKSNGDKQ